MGRLDEFRVTDTVQLNCELVRPRRQVFGFVHHLLVYGRKVGAHDDATLGGVDFRIELSAADQVHDPKLCVFGVHHELRRQAREVDLLVDAAIGFEHEKACGFHEFVGAVAQKVVGLEHGGALEQLGLRAVEVEVDPEALQKRRHRVRVSVVLLLQHAH